VRLLDGGRVDYAAELWQRRNLLLVSIADRQEPVTQRFVADLAEHSADFLGLNTECLVTVEPMPGLPRPSLMIADRWGEIHTLTEISQRTGWPSLDDLIATLAWLEMRCPECEGEAK